MDETTDFTINLLKQKSLTSVVRADIERLILSGQLLPGAKLTEAALVDRLGVSRGPIREAFRLLEAAGLVSQQKNTGVFVREIPHDEAMEIYDVRTMVEESVVRNLAKQRLTAEQHRELRQIIERMTKAVKAEDISTYYFLDLEFHDKLVQYSGNRKVVEIYRKLAKELALVRRLDLHRQNALPRSAAEHRQILNAIVSGDSDAAARIISEHIFEGRKRVLAMLDAASTPDLEKAKSA